MIRRGKHQENYSILPNETLNDEGLGFEALGLLGYLLAKPEDWTVRIADLMRQGGIGRDKCRRLLAKLEEAGYLVRERTRDDATGRMGEIDYVVFDSPNMEYAPRPENQDVVISPRPEKPRPGNPAPVNQTHTKDLSSTKDLSVQSTDAQDLFEEPKKPKRKTSLPPDCPTKEDQDKAREYWKSVSRSDISRDMQNICDQFRAHHEAQETKAKSWSATWKTWYVKQVQFRRPPPGHTPAPPPVEKDPYQRHGEQVRVYLTKGIWNEMEGRAPGVENCQVPREVITRVLNEVGRDRIHPTARATLKNSTQRASA